MKAILPCAGYGTRMRMKLNESKELLIRNGIPLIEYHLNICKMFDLDPIIITRKEKTDLLDYCLKNGIQTKIIEPQGEWPSTVLSSSDLWDENNILLLPDSVFEPVETILDIKKGLLLGNNAVMALHDVEDISKWGSIKDYQFTEKRKLQEPGKAWGIIGFKKDYGLTLFKRMETPNFPTPLWDTGFVYLDSFKDVTRTGKIE